MQIPNLWNFKRILPKNPKQVKNFILNFGPQHPASHGVLRLVVQMGGEHVMRADPHVGFLHRGTEKLMESRTFLKSLPYLDRLDYVSMMTQEHAFCLAVESLMNSTSHSSVYVQIRVVFDELTRILNHLLAISTHSLDVGNMSPVFWAFEEREKIMEFYERVSGARMHAAFYRPNDIDWTGLNSQFFIDLLFFLRNSMKSLTEIFSTLATNRIWKSRLVSIGVLNYETSLGYGTSGPIIRSCGIKRDLRLSKIFSYSNYWFLSLNSFIGKRGDSFDRFLIRTREMYESISIIFQVISNLFTSKLSSKFSFFNFLNSREGGKGGTKFNSMEALISHFKDYSEGIKPPKGLTYASVEAPKGEFGVSLVSDNSPLPFRCKIRTPAYHHIQVMPNLVEGHYLADLVTVLGSQDIVFGDVDR